MFKQNPLSKFQKNIIKHLFQPLHRPTNQPLYRYYYITFRHISKPKIINLMCDISFINMQKHKKQLKSIPKCINLNLRVTFKISSSLINNKQYSLLYNCSFLTITEVTLMNLAVVNFIPLLLSCKNPSKSLFLMCSFLGSAWVLRKILQNEEIKNFLLFNFFIVLD